MFAETDTAIDPAVAATRPASAAVGNLGWAVSLTAIEDLAALGRDWIALERSAAAETSFFLSWAWIGSWLAQVPAASAPHCLAVRQPDRTVVGLAVLCLRRHRRLGILTSRQCRLHESGDPALDSLTMEYNGILTTATDAAAIRTAALTWLVDCDHGGDEVILGGINTDLAALAGTLGSGAGRVVRVIAAAPCPLVDLAAVRTAGGDPLTVLSASTRAAIRRSLRLYGEIGTVEFQIAPTAAAALQDLAELKRLHQLFWTGRGRPGAFSSLAFENFHDTLIRDHFGSGAIQLARVAAGGQTIGYLYNFIWRGRVYAYQSGFDRTISDNRLKPGLVSHYLAIRHAVAAGYGLYDFMAGDGQHKRSLSTGADHLVWLALDADRGSAWLVNRLRRGSRWLRRLTGRDGRV